MNGPVVHATDTEERLPLDASDREHAAKRSRTAIGEIFRAHRRAFMSRLGDRLSGARKRVLHAIADCRTRALGGHVDRCIDCRFTDVSYNSCRNRHCPTCLSHKAADWLEARRRELLPIAYFHVVFTLPAEIAALALGNKKVVYGILFKAASATLHEVARDPRFLGAEIGFLAILHTWNQVLGHHPHLHCIVPGGGLSMGGQTWIPTKPNFLFPVRLLSKVFARHFLRLLRMAYRDDQLRLQGSMAHLQSKDGFSRFSRAMRRKAWVVYSKPPFGSPEQVLKYLARYTHRVAISNARIVSYDDEQVTFRYRDSANGNEKRLMTLPVHEFMRRFLLHALPKGFVRIRSFGFLAHAQRHEKLAICRAAIARQASGRTDELPPPVDAGPAHGHPSVEDEDPLTDLRRRSRHCPRCATGAMVHIQEFGVSYIRHRRIRRVWRPPRPPALPS